MGEYNPQQISFLTFVSSLGSETLGYFPISGMFLISHLSWLFFLQQAMRRWWLHRVSSYCLWSDLYCCWFLISIDSTAIYLIFQNINLSIILDLSLPLFSLFSQKILQCCPFSLLNISQMCFLFSIFIATDLKIWSDILFPISKAFTFLQLAC